MFFNLLDTTTDTQATGNSWSTWVILGVFAVFVIVFMIFNKRSQKKREQEAQDVLNAVKPGSKVKTIGGICGIVVEVCPDDNTFVLETGTEASGRSYIKFDKQAIYQTDAVAAKQEKAEEKAEEKVEVQEEVVEAPVEEAPVEENKTEE